MKKIALVLLAVTAMASVALASTFAKVSTPTNKHLAQFKKAAAQSKSAYLGVLKVTAKTAGRKGSDQQIHAIKEAMHGYMCGFFDDSIDLQKANSKEQSWVLDTLGMIHGSGNAEDLSDAEMGQFTDALEAVLQDATLKTYAGTASGNNTSGNVMGVYDAKNDQLLYFGYTNCGSDD